MSMTPDMFAEGYMGSVDVGAGIAAVGAVLVLILVIGLICLGFSLLCYIFYSLGLYRIAKRRGVHNGWLAWIPIGNLWILGSVSDQYQYVVKGRIRNRRKTLLGLGIASVVLSVLGGVLSFVIGFAAGLTGNGEALVASQLLPVSVWIVGIVTTVFEYIALYDLYHSCDPDDSVLLLVLSILFSVVVPILVFVMRNKDLGMPPRKDAAEQESSPIEAYVELPDDPVALPEEFEDFEDIT